MIYRFELCGSRDYAILHLSQRLTPSSATYSHHIDTRRELGALEKRIIDVAPMAVGVGGAVRVEAYSIMVANCAICIPRQDILRNLVMVLQREIAWDGSKWEQGETIDRTQE